MRARNTKAVVASHKAADEAMGRDWMGKFGCGCAACRMTREAIRVPMTSDEVTVLLQGLIALKRQWKRNTADPAEQRYINAVASITKKLEVIPQ